MAIRQVQLINRADMFIAFAVKPFHVDQNIACLTAISASIHGDGTPNGAGNTAIKTQARQCSIGGGARHTHIERRCTGCHFVIAALRDLAESSTQSDDRAANTTIAHQDIGTGTQNAERHIFRQRRQKGRQIVNISGHENHIGWTANTEPTNITHDKIGHQLTA